MLQGGHGEQTGVLHDHLVPLHDVQEGLHQLAVLQGQHPVHVLLDIGEHQIAGGLYRHAVGDGAGGGQGDHMARLQAGLHGGRAGGLHADDLYIGVEQLGQGGHARGQTAAADGDQDHVHVGQVLEDLIGDGTLTGGQGQVVEGVDIGQALLLRQLGGQFGGIVEHLSVEHHVGPIVLGVVHLHQGGGGGHDDSGGHTGGLGGIGYALGVVSGGGGNQAPGFLLVGEGADLIIGPSNLIRASDLHVFRLQIHVVAAALAEIGRVDQRCGPQHALQHISGFFELFEGKHSFALLLHLNRLSYHTPFRLHKSMQTMPRRAISLTLL